MPMIVQELIAIQERCGYLPAEEMRALSQRIARPLHALHEVASFYPHFKLGPPKQVEVHVCQDMACHLRGLGLLTEPERLLRNVRGLQLCPLERCDECCGFGGSFSVRYPEISGAMVGDKANFIEQTGAEYVIATDAGCLMNIAGCLRRRGSAVQALHLAQVLEKT